MLVLVAGLSIPNFALATFFVWLFSLKGTPHVVRRIDQNGGLGGIAFSLDGSVLYVIERQSYLVVIDPQTGQKIKEFRYPPASGVYGIAGVEAP